MQKRFIIKVLAKRTQTWEPVIGYNDKWDAIQHQNRLIQAGMTTDLIDMASL